MVAGWISLDKGENTISSSPVEMGFKQLGKYPNDILDQMILNCNSEIIDCFRAKPGII